MFAQPATTIADTHPGETSGRSAVRAEFSVVQLELFAAAAIIISIFFLHGFFLRTAGALWRDEVNLVNLAGSNSAAAMLNDSFPILMPLLVKLWLTLGNSDLWLRSLGLLCGLALPAVFWVTGRITGRLPLFGLVLVCLNEYFIRYGDSLRAYGLGTAFIGASFANMLWFLKTPSWRRAALMSGIAVLSVHTLYQNSLLFLAIAAGGLAACWRKRDVQSAIKILAAGLLTAATLLPYLAHLKTLASGSLEIRSRFSPTTVWNSFIEATGFPISQLTAVWLLLILVLILSVFIRVNSWLKQSCWKSLPLNFSQRRSNLSLFAAVTTVSALALFLSFLWFASVPVRPYYWLPPLALIALCFDIATGVTPLEDATEDQRMDKVRDKISGGRPRLIFVAVIIGLALISTIASAQRLRAPFTNADRIVQRLKSAVQPGDFIIIAPWYLGMTFQRYFAEHSDRRPSQPAAMSATESVTEPSRASDTNPSVRAETAHAPKFAPAWQTLPPLADHLTHRYDLVLAQMKNPNALAPIFEKASAALRAGHRVWVAGSMTIPSGHASAPAALPAPPLSGSGFSDWPYANSWTARTAYYLARHSERLKQLPALASESAPIQEHFDLLVAEGWMR